MRMMVAVTAPGLPQTQPFQGLQGHLVDVGHIDNPIEAGVIALERVQADWGLPTHAMRVEGFRLKSRSS